MSSSDLEGPVHISGLVDAVLRKYGIELPPKKAPKAVMPGLEEEFLADPFRALDRVSTGFRDTAKPPEDDLDYAKGQAVLARLDAIVKEVLPGSRPGLLRALVRWRKERKKVAPRHLQSLNEWVDRTTEQLRREGGEVKHRQDPLFQ